MTFFQSNLFWFIEGILACIAIIAFGMYTRDKGIRMPLWRWAALIGWFILLAGVICFTATSLGEGEPQAAFYGAVFGSVIVAVTGVILYRLDKTGIQIILILAVIASLIAAWTAGRLLQKSSSEDILKQTLPNAAKFESGPDEIYSTDTDAYIAIRSAPGYSGPVTVSVAVGTNGRVLNTVLVKQTESAPFFNKVLKDGYPEKFTGKTCTDQFALTEDIDSVTGATVSLEALAKAAHTACADIASKKLGMTPAQLNIPEIKFAAPEIILIVLIITGFAGSSYKYIKWPVLIASVVFLGFLFKWPASLVNINSLMMGYFPRWQSHLYWYILTAAILLPVMIKGKTPFCTTVCPFGATQEILINLGGKKRPIPPKILKIIRAVRGLLVLSAVLCALTFRNPAMISLEIPTTMFTLIGQNWHFILLAVILIASLFITRPWCNTLCPLAAIFDYIRLLRKPFKPTTEARVREHSE